MYDTTQHVIPVQTIFGPGYVAEQYTDGNSLPKDEARYADFVKALTSLLWGDAAPTRH